MPTALVTLASASTAAAAQSAAVGIGVAPSSNGLVMVGVPTQVAVSGTSKADIYLWNVTQRRYFRMGTATPKKALPYTFDTPGSHRARLVPERGKAKTFHVAVYQRYNVGEPTPTNYGGTIITSSDRHSDTWTVAIKADRGCVLVDMGLITIGLNATAQTVTATVQSTGAPPTSFTAVPGAPGARLNIPVQGDIVAHAVASPYGSFEWGRAWTCLRPVA